MKTMTQNDQFLEKIRSLQIVGGKRKSKPQENHIFAQCPGIHLTHAALVTIRNEPHRDNGEQNLAA